MRHISKSLEETREIAEQFVKTLDIDEKAKVVALTGNLGSGKTAFSQAVGTTLGVIENVQSPTFVIEKIYPIDYHGFKHLIHIDAYRLDHSKELLHLGWQKIISEKENLILIEWPERVADIIPKGVQNIYFKFIDESTREIEYEN